MKRTLLLFLAAVALCSIVHLCHASITPSKSLTTNSSVEWDKTFYVETYEHFKLQPVDIGNPNVTCVYGKRKVDLESAIGLFYFLVIQLFLVGLALSMFIAPLSFIPFSCHGFLVTYFVVEISLNDVFIKSDYFKTIMGPGDAYVSGESANRLMFILYTVPIVISRICFVFGSILLTRESFKIEARSNIPTQFTAPRAAFGLIASWALMIYSTMFLYKHGIVSYFAGSSGDTLNGIGCSGPLSYRQLPFIILLLEVLPLLLILFQCSSLTWLYNSISLVCCFTIVIDGFHAYKKHEPIAFTYYIVNATVFIVAIAFSMLLQFCLISYSANCEDVSSTSRTSNEESNLL